VLLFVIDVSPTMTRRDPQTKSSPLTEALECAYNIMLERVISSPRDKIGVFLYGTQQTVPDTNYPNIYTLLALDSPDAMSIKELRDIIHGFYLPRQKRVKRG
jgi:ATP-dependent DNA helicase 2 subunit 1